jgi:hypothetical protein
MLNRSAISKALSFCLNTPVLVSKERENDYIDFRPRQPGTPQVLVDLEKQLQVEPDLGIFDGQLQAFGNGAVRWELYSLVEWLIQRGIRVGAEQAVEDLQTYLNASQLPCKTIEAISGLRVSSRSRFEGGIELVPWESLEESSTKKTIYRRSSESLIPSVPTAAVTQQVQITKLHYKEGDKVSLPRYDTADIDDAIRAICVIGPFAPRIIAAWCELPEWAPSFWVGFSCAFPEGREIRNDIWTDEHSFAAGKLLKSFFSLDAEEKTRLRVPMDRLISGLRSVSPVDAAIDLGIALEALYLDGNNKQTELTFRLKLRIARFLESLPVQRKEIFDLVGVIYDIRSGAVHSGDIPRKFKNSLEAIRAGFDIAARTIRKFIEEGRPDWDSIQLG